MLRKSLVALAAVAALISLSVHEASARGGGRGGGGGFHGGGGGFHGGGFRGGGFHGGGFRGGGGPRMHMGSPGFRGGFARGGWGNRGFVHRGYGWNRPFRRYGFRPYFAPTFYAAPYAYYGGSCFRWRQVWTPYGVQFRRVWVCGRRW